MQPGGSLYGLQHSNPVSTAVAYDNGGDQGNGIAFGTANAAELYERHSLIPDRSNFDLSAADSYGSHPQLMVINAAGGSYYVMLHGTDAAGAGDEALAHAR